MILPKGIDEKEIINKKSSRLQPFYKLSKKQVTLLKNGSRKLFMKKVTLRIIVGLILIFLLITVSESFIATQEDVLVYVGMFHLPFFAVGIWFIYQVLFLKSDLIRCYYGQDVYAKDYTDKYVKKVRRFCAVLIPILYIIAIIMATMQVFIIVSILLGIICALICLIFAVGRYKIGDSGGDLSYCKKCGRLNTIFFYNESREYGKYNSVRSVDEAKTYNYTVGTIYDRDNNEVGRLTGTSTEYTYKYGTQYNYVKKYFCACCGKEVEYKGTDIQWNKFGSKC